MVRSGEWNEVILITLANDHGIAILERPLFYRLIEWALRGTHCSKILIKLIHIVLNHIRDG